MKRILALSFIACALSLSAFAKDIKTVVFTTNPQMHCESCENRIKKNVRFVSGVRKIETSVPQQTVTVEYDADKTSPAKIEAGFKKIGYQVRQLKPGERVQKHEGGSCSNM